MSTGRKCSQRACEEIVRHGTADVLVGCYVGQNPHELPTRTSAVQIRSQAQRVTTKKPWPRYASTRKPDVRSLVIHSSASLNTRWVADCDPCQSVGPRKRNPRHGTGINSWLSPISFKEKRVVFLKHEFLVHHRPRDNFELYFPRYGSRPTRFSSPPILPNSRASYKLSVALETAVELISRKDAETQNKKGRFPLASQPTG